jgi:hypothetical protein|tara:strand:+ start:198 stop:341 length:144 start_codon:yes stop_codon:yes gene_type:complete
MMLVEIKLEDSVKSEEVENLQKYFGNELQQDNCWHVRPSYKLAIDDA